VVTLKARYIAFPLIIILLSAFGITYASQVMMPNTVNVWISNDSCIGMNVRNETSAVIFANIKTNDSGTHFYGDGLRGQVNVSDVKLLSICRGVLIWANDSLNTYQFPMLRDRDHLLGDTLYLEVTNLHTVAAVEGKSSVMVETFNIHGPIADQKAYAYVDLDTVENSLNIQDNMSYTLSITANISTHVTLPPIFGLSSSPDKLFEQKTIALGTIEIKCINGIREIAYIDFPYIFRSFPVQTPYLHTIF